MEYSLFTCVFTRYNINRFNTCPVSFTKNLATLWNFKQKIIITIYRVFSLRAPLTAHNRQLIATIKRVFVQRKWRFFLKYCRIICPIDLSWIRGFFLFASSTRISFTIILSPQVQYLRKSQHCLWFVIVICFSWPITNHSLWTLFFLLVQDFGFNRDMIWKSHMTPWLQITRRSRDLWIIRRLQHKPKIKTALMYSLLSTAELSGLVSS